MTKLAPTNVPQIREARLVVPLASHKPMSHIVHSDVRGFLLRYFGGYTSTPGNGGWFDNDNKREHIEPVIVYDVAAPATPDNAVKLRQIAVLVRDTLQEQCVYLRNLDGQVALV